MPVKRKKNLKHTAISLLLLLFATWIFLSGPQVSRAATDALLLCGKVLLPSLFPFFVVSNLVISLGIASDLSHGFSSIINKLFRLPGECGTAIALGAIGGYPIGAKTAVSLYQNRHCSKEEALHLLSFCNNASPAFLISAVGANLLGSAKFGVLLYLIHFLSACIIGIISPRKASINKEVFRENTCCLNSRSFLSVFLSAVSDAMNTFFTVCAYVIFFAIVACMLHGPHPASGFLLGILEMTGGIAALAQSSVCFPVKCAMISFLAGFGGLSVQCQTLHLLQRAGLPCRRYLFCKLLHGLISAFLTFAIFAVMP